MVNYAQDKRITHSAETEKLQRCCRSCFNKKYLP